MFEQLVSRRRGRLVALFLIVASLAAACGTSGAPEAYEEQEKSYTNLLEEEVSASVTEVNYRQACEETNANMEAGAAIAFCQCTYNKWVDNVPFDLFIAFQNRINEKQSELSGGNFEQLAIEYASVVDDLEADLKASGAEYEQDLSKLIGFPCEAGA